MLKRKIISQLEEWKDNHFHEALLIKGARQVGKTTIVREFAKDNYTHFVEINFEKDPQAQEAFTENGIAMLSSVLRSPMAIATNKDLGKKWFGFVKLEQPTDELLSKM